MKAAALLALLGLPAAAQEFVEASGRLADIDFYRAVACAAPPGGACRKPYLRWPEARRAALSVTLASIAPGLRDYRRDIYEAGIDSALAEINGLALDVRMIRTDGAADIEIHVVDTPPGEVMRGTGVPGLDGAVLELGRVALRAREGEIREALIAISADARRREIASLLLEEIVQGLGLMTDVRGPGYRRSLFSEDGNSVVRIEGQDAMALRRHYAPPGTRPVPRPEKES